MIFKIIPEELFISAVWMKDIVNINLQGETKDKIKKALIKSKITGVENEIEIKNLEKHYKFMNTENIKLYKLHSGIKIIYADCEIPVQVAYIPERLKAKVCQRLGIKDLNDDTDNSCAVYIVYGILEDGEEKDTMLFMVDKELFRKSFRVIGNGMSVKEELCSNNKKIAEILGKNKLVNIIKQVKEGNKVLGFIVQDMEKQTMKLGRKEIMRLGRKGKIRNAKVIKNGDKEMIEGIGVNLLELPEVEEGRA